MFKQTHVLTKQQRKALKQVYDRSPLWNLTTGRNTNPMDFTWGDVWNADTVDDSFHSYGKPLTYRQFRKSVSLAFDCIMIPWRGMWLGIEHDGYTHS